MQEPQEMGVQSLGWEDPLEEETATRSNILVGKIIWTEEPGRLSPWSLKQSEMTEHAPIFSLHRKC